MLRSRFITLVRGTTLSPYIVKYLHLLELIRWLLTAWGKLLLFVQTHSRIRSHSTSKVDFSLSSFFKSNLLVSTVFISSLCSLMQPHEMEVKHFVPLHLFFLCPRSWHCEQQGRESTASSSSKCDDMDWSSDHNLVILLSFISTSLRMQFKCLSMGLEYWYSSILVSIFSQSTVSSVPEESLWSWGNNSFGRSDSVPAVCNSWESMAVNSALLWGDRILFTSLISNLLWPIGNSAM